MSHIFHMVGILAVSISLLACTAKPPLSSTNSSMPEGVLLERNVQVTMRDGARLNTLVMLPAMANKEGGGQVPAILIRTPYKSELDPLRDLHKTLLAQGYALIMQNERGRFFSEGEFTMLVGALDDGWDTLDWITNQSWSNGKVGTYGCSSSAENQLKLAAAGHPAHQAMVVGSSGVGVAQAGPFKEQGNFWRGGAWQQGWMNYFHTGMIQDWPQLPATMTNDERQRTLAYFDLTNVAWQQPASIFNATRMHLPMIDILAQMGAGRTEVADYLQKGPSHPSYGKVRVSEGEIISVPGLWFESLYDISARSVISYFEFNRAANAQAGNDNQRLKITQGGHCTFGSQQVEKSESTAGELPLGDMRYDYAGMVVDWFNRWLKPEQTSPSLSTKAITSFTGYGQWIEADRLPTSNSVKWHLSGGGQLNNAAQATTTSMQYEYDPSDPVISVGGEIYGVGDDQFDGSFDQRKVQARSDVLVFTSAPFTTDTILFGLSDVHLSVSSNRPDTDFTVKINDVYPDGRAFNIGDTILRMRYREGMDEAKFMQSDEIYQISLPPIMLSRTIRKGHRIQVEVSSSNFPAYARNLNTDQDPYTSMDFVSALNTVYLGAGHSSMISLPVHVDGYKKVDKN